MENTSNNILQNGLMEKHETLFNSENVPMFVLGPYKSQPLTVIDENSSEGYSSLPPDLIRKTDKCFENRFKQIPWEAEDADFINTLDEKFLIKNNKQSLVTILAEVHSPGSESTSSLYNLSQQDLFQSDQSFKKHLNLKNSNYDDNNSYCAIKSDDEISLIAKSDTDILDNIYGDKIKSHSTSNSIHNNDGLNSMNSSYYEKKSIGSSIEYDNQQLFENSNGININKNNDRAKDVNVLAENDLESIKKLLETESSEEAVCPSCRITFDKGKRRKLIDTCGHEKCYSCVFTNEQCLACLQQSEANKTAIKKRNKQILDYDTGIRCSNTNNRINSTYTRPRSGIIGSNQNIQKSGVTDNLYYGISSKPYLQVNTGNTQLNGSPLTSKREINLETTPQCTSENRRRFFHTKNLKSPFRQRRSNTTNLDNQINLTLSGLTSSKKDLDIVKHRVRDTARTSENINKTYRLSFSDTSAYAGHLGSLVFGKIKSLWSSHTSAFTAGLNQLSEQNDVSNNEKSNLINTHKVTTRENDLQLQNLLENKMNNKRFSTGLDYATEKFYSSLTSSNASPVSTLTESSEADIRLNYNCSGSDSIDSSMNVSIPEQIKNGTEIPVNYRYSIANNLQPNIFYNSRVPLSLGNMKDNMNSKMRFVEYRQPQLMLKPLFFEIPQQEDDSLFIGRNWLLREISNTLTTTESPGILIHGNVGTGKTTIILQLVEYSCFGRRKELPSIEAEGIYCQINVVHDRIRALSSHVVAYHFCQADNYISCLVPDFIHSIAAQMCQAPQLVSYREHLLNEPHLQNILSIRECIVDPYRAMRKGILEPLSILRNTGKISGKNCIILIDGLCEAEHHRPDHGDTLGVFLVKISEFFPPWLKVVVSVQTGFLEFVKGLPYTKISLDNLNLNDNLQKDILDYVSYRVSHSTDILNNLNIASNISVSATNTNSNEVYNSTDILKFAQHLFILSKGSFLFVKLTLDLIERGSLVIKSASYNILPISLAQIYLLNFNLRFPTTAAFEKISKILCICLAALSPMTITEIFYTLNSLTEQDELSYEEFLKNLKTLQGFLIKRIDSTLMFFHSSFKEWLIRRDGIENNKFLCDPKIGHVAISLRLSRMDTPLKADQTLELCHHILKAHLYRNTMQQITSRDLQALWISSVTNDASASLCSLRNVYSPNIKVTKLLLLSGASPNYITEFLGNAPILCIAAYEGNIPMVSLLLEFGADVQMENSQGCTPLILAASKGHCDVVRLLVAAGSLLGHVDTSQRCALVHAARSGRLNVVKYLLASDWELGIKITNVSLMDAAQQSLVEAASQGCIEIVEELLDSVEVNINAIDKFTGETALTSATLKGFTQTVTDLLSRGADVNIKNRKNTSPMLLAVKEGNWEIVDRLLQAHADIEQTDNNGKSALMIAAEEGHIGILELLLNHNASLSICDREGLTALSWACLRGKLQTAKCLIDRNADKHHVDNTGRTPLDLAVYQGSAALVQMLIENGVKIEHIDSNGMRSFDRAVACRNLQVVQVFLKRGVKLGPTTWAMAAGKPEILVLLLNKLLEDGNILYRKNRISEAAHRYQYALKKIPLNECNSMSSCHYNTFKQLKFNILLNYSRCLRKMKELSESIDLATQAIELKPEIYDGFFARSKAYFEFGNLTEALKDIEMAIERFHMTKNGLPDVRNILFRLRDNIVKIKINKLDSDSDCLDSVTDL